LPARLRRGGSAAARDLGGRAWASHSFADFINPNWASIAADYRTRFIASERLVAPRLSVGVVAICAGVGEEAQGLASSSRMICRCSRAAGS
jgi:hypothetical protein